MFYSPSDSQLPWTFRICRLVLADKSSNLLQDNFIVASNTLKVFENVQKGSRIELMMATCNLDDQVFQYSDARMSAFFSTDAGHLRGRLLQTISYPFQDRSDVISFHNVPGCHTCFLRTITS